MLRYYRQRHVMTLYNILSNALSVPDGLEYAYDAVISNRNGNRYRRYIFLISIHHFAFN